ncbi:MAG: ribonuclease E activity regulator RraA [Chitinophagales bacterium]
MQFKTADLSDEHREILQVAQPIFLSFGAKPKFCGEIVTVKLFEDNVLAKEQLGKDGTGKVLVVDGGGSERVALMGDNVAALAIKNGWEGVVIFGCIRDAADIDEMGIGIRAIGTHPFKSHKKGEGDVQITVQFAGCTFQPGHFLYADEDGLIISPKKLL